MTLLSTIRLTHNLPLPTTIPFTTLYYLFNIQLFKAIQIAKLHKNLSNCKIA